MLTVRRQQQRHGWVHLLNDLLLCARQPCPASSILTLAAQPPLLHLLTPAAGRLHCRFCCCRCCRCLRYVNGADPNRRLGSFRNLADVLGSTPSVSLDPGLKDWRVIEGGGAMMVTGLPRSISAVFVGGGETVDTGPGLARQ
jgi:hypothetical protein